MWQDVLFKRNIREILNDWLCVSIKLHKWFFFSPSVDSCKCEHLLLRKIEELQSMPIHFHRNRCVSEDISGSSKGNRRYHITLLYVDLSIERNHPFRQNSGDSLEFGFGCAEDTLIVLHLWSTVALVVHLQAVVEKVQVLFHLLGLVNWVRVQNLHFKGQNTIHHKWHESQDCNLGQDCNLKSFIFPDTWLVLIL